VVSTHLTKGRSNSCSQPQVAHNPVIRDGLNRHLQAVTGVGVASNNK
jgi:hypothetical protein